MDHDDKYDRAFYVNGGILGFFYSLHAFLHMKVMYDVEIAFLYN